MGKLDEGTKHLLDTIAAGAGVAVWLEAIPHLVGIFTIIWLGIRIVETDTVKNLFKWLRDKVKGMG